MSKFSLILVATIALGSQCHGETEGAAPQAALPKSNMNVVSVADAVTNTNDLTTTSKTEHRQIRDKEAPTPTRVSEILNWIKNGAITIKKVAVTGKNSTVTWIKGHPYKTAAATIVAVVATLLIGYAASNGCFTSGSLSSAYAYAYAATAKLFSWRDLQAEVCNNELEELKKAVAEGRLKTVKKVVNASGWKVDNWVQLCETIKKDICYEKNPKNNIDFQEKVAFFNICCSNPSSELCDENAINNYVQKELWRKAEDLWKEIWGGNN